MSTHKHLTFSKNKKSGKTFINFITPIGTAIFPKLIEADEYKGKKSWKTKLSIPIEDAQAFIDELQPVLDEYVEGMYEQADAKTVAKYKKAWSVKDIGEEETDDDGNPTGNIIFNFGKNATTKDGKSQPPPALFDSFNQPAEVNDIWGGSKLRVAGFLYLYDMGSSKEFGVSLKMQGEQIVELRGPDGGGRSAESMGFGTVDGGFGGSSVSKDTEYVGGTDDDSDGDEEF